MIRTFGTDEFENFGYIAGSITDNMVYIVFRGTVNLSNWLTNLNIVKSNPKDRVLDACNLNDFPNLVAKSNVSEDKKTSAEKEITKAG